MLALTPSSIASLAAPEKDVSRLQLVEAAINLLLACPHETLHQNAGTLDTTLSALCAQIPPRDCIAIQSRLQPLAALFPQTMDTGRSLQSVNSTDRLKPELASSDGLTSAPVDLALVARTAPCNQLLAMAGLPDLSPAVTGILVSRGTPEVLHRLTANNHAQFARSSFSTLIELAPCDMQLKTNMACRTDLPEGLALRLLPFLNHGQKIKLFTAGANIDTAQAANDLNAEREVYGGSGVDPSRALDNTIQRLCEDARISEITEVLADRLAIPHAASMNLLCGRLDYVAGLLVFAAGGSESCIQPILDLRQQLECRSSKDRRAAYEPFSTYKTEEARSIVIECVKSMQSTGLFRPEFDFSVSDDEAPEADL